MESENLERRDAPRYTIPARVWMRPENGQPIAATAVNISSSGMLVCAGDLHRLRAGEAVTVEVELATHCAKALSTWGMGVVVRTDGGSLAIQLRAGSFCETEEAGGCG